MIKAIIFDFFGVVVSEGYTSFVNDFLGSDKNKRAKARILVDDFNSGINGMSYQSFITRLSSLANVDEEVAINYLDKEHPNRELLDFIKKDLKPKYKIGLLSNAGQDWLGDLLAEDDTALFDEIALSFHHKMVKPDERFYRLIANNLNVETKECIFVDDIQRYCTGAINAGMQAIQYKDSTQFKKDLHNLLKI